MIHLEVAVTAPLEHTLTYKALPELFAAEDGGDGPGAIVGRRVLVPLGARRVTGYVLAVIPETGEDGRIREVLSCLDGRPLFPENLVPFYRWAADYYHYPIGMVLKSALPAGLSGSVRRRLARLGDEAALRERLLDGGPPWLAEVASRGRLGYDKTKKLLAEREQRQLLQQVVAEGLVAVVEDRPRDGVGERYQLSYALTEEGWRLCGDGGVEAGIAATKACGDEGMRRPTRCKAGERRLLPILAACPGRESVPVERLREEGGRGTATALASLVARGLVEERRTRLYRSPFGAPLPFYGRPQSLSEAQRRVLAEILPNLCREVYCPVLLHGVTGCGKTEVYLQAAEETLRRGGDVLVLVPEIALATQLESHFLSRFADQVVLLHSGLSGAERFDQYSLALDGQARVVIGARSAVFAPLRHLALIIVDEEHDAGFKQDEGFCYHGRDLAVLRASLQRCTVILGSATPSVTSYSHGKSGKYRLLTMAERVFERQLPAVTVVDLSRREAKEQSGIIGPALLKRLAETLAQGRQAILLLNRRGFASAFLCRDCGTPVQCSHCHVALTLHKGRNRLVCHYCGFSCNAATICASCRGSDLAPAGFGTERVEEEVRQLLPEARIARLDSDSALDRRGFFATLGAMHRGEIDILVGTQMIAKGHHFPGVTLVGVVWADGGISMPDFRAAERTFQLLTQVTGRAGRGEVPGEVIIQTLRPDHYAIVHATRHDYQGLFEHELRLRRQPRFPPFVRLVALRIRGRVEKEVQDNAAKVAALLRRQVAEDGLAVEVLGPAPAPLDKIRDRYRWQVLLKGADSEALKTLCRKLRKERATLLARSCELAIDVDPESMM